MARLVTEPEQLVPRFEKYLLWHERWARKLTRQPGTGLCKLSHVLWREAAASLFVTICACRVQAVAVRRKRLSNLQRPWLGTSYEGKAACFRIAAITELQLFTFSFARRARAARVADSSLLVEVARVCLVLADKGELASFTVKDWVIAGCE